MATPVTPGHQVFWAPPQAVRAYPMAQSPTKQHDPSASLSLQRISSSQATLEGAHQPNGQASDEPIVIPSDTESEMGGGDENDDDEAADEDIGRGDHRAPVRDETPRDMPPSMQALITSHPTSTEELEDLVPGLDDVDAPTDLFSTSSTSTAGQDAQQVILDTEMVLSSALPSSTCASSTLPTTAAVIPCSPPADEMLPITSQGIGEIPFLSRCSLARIDDVLQPLDAGSQSKETHSTLTGRSTTVSSCKPPQTEAEASRPATTESTQRRHNLCVSEPEEKDEMSAQDDTDGANGTAQRRKNREPSGNGDDETGRAYGVTESYPSMADNDTREQRKANLKRGADKSDKQSSKRRKLRPRFSIQKPDDCVRPPPDSSFTTRSSTRTRQQAQTRSPPASHAASEDEGQGISMPAASFEEWSLQNAVLKRVMMNGVVTFQLQFEWPMCTKHGQVTATRKTPRTAPSRTTTGRAARVTGTSCKVTTEQDGMLTENELTYESAEERGELIDDGDKFTVDRICTRWSEPGKQDTFLVKWKIDGSTTWEPRRSLEQDVKDMLLEFEASFQGFDDGVRILRFRTLNGVSQCRLRFNGRPPNEDEWVDAGLITPECIKRWRGRKILNDVHY